MEKPGFEKPGSEKPGSEKPLAEKLGRKESGFVQSWLAKPHNRAVAVLAAAVAFGGGGVGYGFANLGVLLVALAMLAWSAVPAAAFLRAAPRGLTALVGASLALPLLHIIPLPEALWSQLPGRGIVRETLLLAGGGGWFPLSVDAGRSLVAFLGLVAPFAIVCLAWNGSPRQLAGLARATVLLGCGCALLGMAEMLTGRGALLYPENPMPGVLFGTFANRNSTALFLDCCLILLAASPWRGLSFTQTGWRIGAAAILAVAVVLTQSRTGLLLLCMPALLAATRLFVRLRHEGAVGRLSARFGRGALFGGAALACGVMLVTTLVAVKADRVESVLARFGQDDARRPAIWEDAMFSAGRFWPVGAGMGTFDEVFQIDESLESLSPRTAGRAHNDYLEIAIEAGFPGLALVAGWIVWCLAAAVRARRSPHRWLAWGGAGALMAIALQSLLDYPLRNQTMFCVAALAVAILASACPPSKSRAS